MEYLVLYRKWRPRGFGDYVGQPHVVRTLRHAVAQNRVAHAYLFCGPRGTGKTTTAKILARAVNCAAPKDGDPCGECPSCRRIAGGVSLDVQEIDGASNRGIDEVRDLREKVRFAPVEGRFRVYIIDEIHMLTGEAFNALLKTLEEPPPHVIFVFATTEPHKLPATVLSRCQRFDFKRFSQRQIVDRLTEIAAAEGIEVEPDALALLAAQASGSMRDAIGLLEQVAVHAGERVTLADARDVLGLVDLEVFRRLAKAIGTRDAGAALAVLTDVTAAGKDLVQFTRGAASLCRDLLVLILCRGPVPLQILPLEEAGAWRPLADAIGPERLLGAVEILAVVAAEQRRAGEGRLTLDLALIKITAAIDGATGSEARAAPLDERPATSVAPKGASPGAGDPPPIIQGLAYRSAGNPASASGSDTTHRPAAPAPTGDDVQRWQAVLARLHPQKNRSLQAYVAQFARPVGLRGQAFVLSFKSREFIAKVEENRALLERILAEVYGGPLSLHCEVGMEVGTIEQAAAGEAEEAARIDPIAETVRLFDGTLEEE